MSQHPTQILPANYRVPAQWESQEAVYLATTSQQAFDPSQFTGRETTTIESVHAAVVRGLVGHTKVRLLSQTRDEGLAYARRIGAAELSADAFEIIPIAHCDIWVRDTGPIWARSEHGDLAMVWAGFDNWGYFPWITGPWASCDVPNYIPRDLGAALSIPVHRAALMTEGGDKSFNGRGSLICCRAVEKDRNPALSLTKIEKLLRRSFNVANVIWVNEGLADDAQTFRVHAEYQGAPLPGRVFTPIGTGGHVDEFCRFIGPTTVVLAEVHETRRRRMTAIEKISHARMEANKKLLEEQRDQDGAPLRILRMPLPPPLVYTIDHRDPIWWTMRALRGVSIERPIRVVLTASYCNFLVSNGVVLFPRYYAPGMSELVDRIDRDARAIIEQAFPDHRIVTIDQCPINAGGGGINCVTNDQPRA